MTRRRGLLCFLILVLLFIPKLSDQIAKASFEKFRNPDLALILNFNDATLAMSIGNYFFGGGEYDLKKAEKSFKRAVGINPGVLRGHYQLARIYFIENKFDSALEEINRELEYNSENLRALYVRGLIYGFSGKLADAEKDFLRFTQWAPKEWAGYNDLAWVLSKQGKDAEAENIILLAFKKAIRAEENPWLWNALGVAELNVGKYKEALLAFKKANVLTENLTLEDWRRAYPGNNPATARSGIRQFRNAVAKNLQKAEMIAVEK